MDHTKGLTDLDVLLNDVQKRLQETKDALAVLEIAVSKSLDGAKNVRAAYRPQT